MRHVKIAVVAAGCLLAVSMAAAVRASAHGEGGAWESRRGPAMTGRGYFGFLAGVQLTGAQRDQMRQIIKSAWQQDRAQIKQLVALRSQIADQMASSGAVTPDSVDALQQQAAQVREQLDADKLAIALQVRGLLTPDQLGKSASVHTQLKALHEQERALLDQGRPTAD